jgi:hypothetical protein
MDIRKDVFEVRNISDDRNEVGQGTVEVTATDLIYIDSMTNEKWKWPFKFLRKYGFEGSIFTFEAGRRCPGGQGLYAFATERANEIHEAIIENIKGRKNHAGKVSSGGGNSPRTNPRLSLTCENMTSPPPIQLPNRNQYDVTNSPGSTRKWVSANNSPLRSGVNQQKLENPTFPHVVTPPTTTPASTDAPSTSIDTTVITDPSVTLPIATPTSVGTTPTVSEANTSSKKLRSGSTTVGVVTPPTSSDPTRDSPHFTDSLATPSVSTSEEDNASPTSPHNLVKPALDPPRAVVREHLYDVPRYGSGMPLNKDVKSSVTTRSGSFEHTYPEVLANPPSKFGRKGSSTQDGLAEVSMVVADDGGCGSVSVKGGKKEKQNVLSWLKGRKARSGSTNAEERTESKPKKKRSSRGRKKSSRSGPVHEEEKAHMSDETDNLGAYENLTEARLQKTSFSASCDNILESLSMSDSLGSSSVPQPSLRAPILNSHSFDVSGSILRPDSVSSTSLSEDTPFSATPTSATTTVYQNLQEATSHENETAHTTPNIPPTDMPSHLYSNVELSSVPEGTARIIAPPTDAPSPLYSNVRESENQITSQQQMTYTMVDIISAPPGKPRAIRQSSLSSIAVDQRHSPQSTPGFNRQRSQSTFQSTVSASLDGGDGGVVYAGLDFMAMSTVAQLKAERQNIRNFEDVLERHDVREMEMDSQRRRKVNIT